MAISTGDLGAGLQKVRKRARLSQTTVASKLGVTRQVVSAYESGKREVSAVELQILCNLFRVHPDDILGFSRPYKSTGAFPLDFRMNDDFTKLTEHDQQIVEEFVTRTEEGNTECFHRWKHSFRKYNSIARHSFGSLQQLTEAIRKDHSQEEPPINIYLLAELLGVVVMPEYMESPAALVCRPVDKHSIPPRILVNSNQPLDRQRFSISHELAHLFLHQEEIILHAHYFRRQFDQKEVDADSFAGELLMPRDLLRQSIERLKSDMAIEKAVFLLSYLYQVSFLAMATRLHYLQLITKSLYDRLAKVRPSELEGAADKKSGARPFTPERLLPSLVSELWPDGNVPELNQDEVRKLQEIAYTCYLGKETQGGNKPTILYELEPPNTVYEKVVLWVAEQYPMNKQ